MLNPIRDISHLRLSPIYKQNNQLIAGLVRRLKSLGFPLKLIHELKHFEKVSFEIEIMFPLSDEFNNWHRSFAWMVGACALNLNKRRLQPLMKWQARSFARIC